MEADRRRVAMRHSVPGTNPAKLERRMVEDVMHLLCMDMRYIGNQRLRWTCCVTIGLTAKTWCRLDIS